MALGFKSAKPFFHVCLLALIVSCSSSPRENEGRVNQRFSTISIVSTDDLISADAADIDSPGQTEVTIAGGATGAVGGAMIGAAACAPTGPYAALCAAAAVIPGAIAGLLTGATAANLWWSGTVSHEEALYLKEEASYVAGTRDWNEELAQALKQELPDEVVRPAPEADVQVIPLIEEIAFLEADDDLVRMKISAVLVFSDGKSGDSARHGHFRFSAKSERRLIDEWLDEEGGAIAKAMDNGLAKIAGRMTKLILEKRSS